MSSELPTAPIPPAQEAGGSLSRLLRVFTSPAEAFGELAASPTWLPPLLLLLALAIGMQLLIGPRLDLEQTIRDQLAESSRGRQMSEEEINRAVELGSKGGGVMRWLTPVTVPLIYLIVGGVYFLGLKVAGSSVEFKSVFATVLHASVPPGLVKTAVLAAAVIRRASYTAQELEGLVKSNLGAFLPEGVPKVLKALAGIIDIFNIWQWVLLAIGLSIVGKVKRGKVVAIIAVVWGAWALVKMGLAAVQ